jgi:hypothetical protein
MEKLDDELDRRFSVVVKDYLETAGLGLNIGHGIIAPDYLLFRDIALVYGAESRTKQERNHYSNAQKLERRKRQPAAARSCRFSTKPPAINGALIWLGLKHLQLTQSAIRANVHLPSTQLRPVRFEAYLMFSAERQQRSAIS